jgi:DNA-binding NtrC family response regulator
MTFSGYPKEGANASFGPERLTSTPTRVLLVDDDRIFARSLARSLRVLGFTVDVSHDGGQAIQLLDQRHYDAVLLDLEMHPVDGWQVLDLHANLHEPPPVVVLSGHLDVPRTVRALRAGVTDAYQKPIDPIELARGLRDAIVKRSGDAAPTETEPGTADDPTNQIVGHAPALHVVRSQIRRVARYRDLPVLIVSEPGCEQEVIARAIHALDGTDGPFESIDCARTDPTELERELFGVSAAPFASSRGGQAGLFERAHGGTLFFENISETPAALQARLLHVLETRRYRRLSGNEEQVFSARVVSSTRREILQGRIEGMRPDLYYRLAGITVALPPLRARTHDIAALVEHYARTLVLPGNRRKRFSSRALGALQSYDWPGNLRELETVVAAAMRHATGDSVGLKAVRAAMAERWPAAALDSQRPSEGERSSTPPTPAKGSLPVVERTLITKAFEAAQGNISEAARQLGLPRSTMRDKLRRLGLV